MPRPKAEKKPNPPAAPARANAIPLLFEAALVLAAFICFSPLVRYFFAQDDFVFLERAAGGFADAVGPFFEARPGQFRPLTKGLYFLLTWPVFGFNPAPYHVASIVLHAGNAILLALLLRRMGATVAASRFTAVLFVGTVGYIEAVAWVSCVQQLIGCAFMQLALIFGIDALERGGRWRRIASASALVLAFSSYEQTLATPAVLFGWYAMRHGVRGLAAAARRLPEQPILLVAYLLGVLVAKGVPDSGPYAMSLGAHVLDNLRTYTALAYAVWIVLPAYGLPTGFTPSHAVLIVVTAFLLFRRRLPEVAFGLGAFLALLAPVLFVKEHTHSFHLYVPAIGTWFLFAVALGDVLAPLGARAGRSIGYALAAAAGLVILVSAVVVRENTRAILSETVRLPRSFVLRRAVLAERVCQGIRAKSALHGKAGRLVLVYPMPQYRANWLNIHAALGQGSAVRLVLGNRDLDVLFVPPAEPPPPTDPGIEVLYYSEVGVVYTPDEMDAVRRRTESK